MRIFVSGLVNVETTVAVRGFPIDYYPIDYPFFGVNSSVSGVGCNVAGALTRLGDSVCLHSLIGRDPEGRRVLERLAADGVDVSRIRQDLDSTPVSVVLYDLQGRRQIYCDLKDIQERRLDPEAAEADLAACDAAVLCNIGFNRELLRPARARGLLTATDVHVLRSVEDDYNRDFMENADLLFLSDEGLPCAPEDFLRQLEDRYHNRVIVLGRGGKGAMLLDAGRGEVLAVPAYAPPRIVNTVGAGDALFSAFLHFYLKYRDAEAALRRAVIFAGLKIGAKGAAEGFRPAPEIESICQSLYR